MWYWKHDPGEQCFAARQCEDQTKKSFSFISFSKQTCQVSHCSQAAVVSCRVLNQGQREVAPGHTLCPVKLLVLISPASPCMFFLPYVTHCGPESLGNMKQTLILQDSVLLQMGGDTKSSFQSIISLWQVLFLLRLGLWYHRSQGYSDQLACCWLLMDTVKGEVCCGSTMNNTLTKTEITVTHWEPNSTDANLHYLSKKINK